MSGTSTSVSMPVTFVHSQEGLLGCAEHLRGKKELALDLEFDNNRYAYGFHLCVMQVASDEQCFVIDALAAPDLQSLYALFEDPSILKVLHCPGEDLRLLHSLGCKPRNLFDSDITAKFLNYETTSLATMLELKLGITRDKKLQKSNWYARPLTEEQIHYAAKDVTHLLELRAALLEEVDSKGLTDLVRSESEYLETIDFGIKVAETFVQKPDQLQLSPFDQYVFQDMLEFRDDLARERNKPPYHIMAYELVRSFVIQEIPLSDWTKLSGIYRSLRSDEFGQRMIDRMEHARNEATRRGLSLEPGRPPLSREERVLRSSQRNMWEQERLERFVPIQLVLAERFGSFAARHILSTGTVQEILREKQTLRESGSAVRIQIIHSIAAELGIDLSKYS